MSPLVVSLVKFVHVLAVVLFLGNVALAPYRRKQARASGNEAFVAYTYQGHARSGRSVTMPWLVVTVLSGLALAYLSGYDLLRTGWLFWSVAITVVATVLFVVRLAPLQREAAYAAMKHLRTRSEDDRASFEQLAVRLEPWGRISGSLLYVVLALMVVKPPLPGAG